MWMFLCQCSCDFPHVTPSCRMWSLFYFLSLSSSIWEKTHWIQFVILQAGCLYFHGVFPYFKQEYTNRRTSELVLLLHYHPRPWESSTKIVRFSVTKYWCKNKVLPSPETEEFQQMGRSWCSSTSDCHNPCSHQRTTPPAGMHTYPSLMLGWRALPEDVLSHHSVLVNLKIHFYAVIGITFVPVLVRSSKT